MKFYYFQICISKVLGNVCRNVCIFHLPNELGSLLAILSFNTNFLTSSSIKKYRNAFKIQTAPIKNIIFMESAIH